ncbi:Cysteine-rich secretory protein family protein [Acinetobacter calcoaceticus]|uniref:Cysteine-rich secretory protein family protein n=1 Tax=Acinetobacter calcoaceticus TaxID=471 RepID=A0A446ZH06_ACICA|nr:CAP domain-containing protein [Acinetobacter calcoaceticus]VAX43743.1 Cysteine-rich secretory protein family protein [Acinetobacter calcoaceticus]
MSLLKNYSLLPLTLFICACSANTLPMPTDTTPSIAQIQKTAIEISCQDLQNPAYQQAVLDRINQVRQQSRQCGQQYFSAAKPLSWNNNLYKGALAHSVDMANHNFLSHVSSTGQDFRTRLKNYNALGKANGENVASGQKTLNEVITKWIASPLHCSNIMNPKFTTYALACASDQSVKQKSYWTQQFGTR